LNKVQEIPILIENLVSFAYPELQQSSISISWGKTSSYAQIQWNRSKDNISIKISNDVKIWHEAGIIGLISHELSHPTQKGRVLSEFKTDNDVISRGLGPYLAIERLFAGKYIDHRIINGRDRYLGYRSIRNQLTNLETQQLDTLLSRIQLAPAKPHIPIWQSHDTVIINDEHRSNITIEGHQFLLPNNVHDPDIKLVERNNITLIYADDILVGEYPVKDV